MKVGCFVGEKMVSSLQEKKENMYLCNQNLRRELLKKLYLLPVGCEVEWIFNFRFLKIRLWSHSLSIYLCY